ncbi:MAG: hypothetical protein JNM43_22335 [Planctomycetaceae bacterium]|nr:hypothetical protein [Planctomycetaceae bacterium]
MLSGVKGRYSNTITFTYDDRGQQTQETLQFSASGPIYTVTISHDVIGQTTRIEYPAGEVVDRQYDPCGRLNQLRITPVNGNVQDLLTLAYDLGGREIQRVIRNGLQTTTTYTQNGNIATISTPNVDTLSYIYDANNNPLTEARTGVMIPHSWSSIQGYDNNDRLIFRTSEYAGADTWILSPANDWTATSTTLPNITENRTHSLAHEISYRNQLPVAWDSKGNLQNGADGKQLSWDFDNHLSHATVSTAGSVAQFTFEYDAIGRRVRTIQNSAENGDVATDIHIHFLWQEISTASSKNGSYLNSIRVYGEGIDDLVCQYGDNGESEYYHRNRQQSVTAVSDNLGAVKYHVAYTAYGDPLKISPSGAVGSFASSSKSLPLFTSRDYLGALGLYYFRTRFYSPTLGRFIGRDQLTYADGTNLYAGYFSVHGVDPTGMAFGWPKISFHHWFDSTARKLLESKCGRLLGEIGVAIEDFSDLFTTPFEGGWGVGTSHHQIHFPPNGDSYRDRVRQLDDPNLDCCDLMKGMRNIISDLWREHTLGPGAQGPVLPPPMYQYPWRDYPRHNFNPNQTQNLLDWFTDGWCRRLRTPRCPEPKIIPVPVPFPIFQPVDEPVVDPVVCREVVKNGVIIYVCYKGARLIVNAAFPPSWPLLPANAALP